MQPPSHKEQAAERKQGEELGAVLGKAAVAGLHMAELALDDAERMLTLARTLAMMRLIRSSTGCNLLLSG